MELTNMKSKRICVDFKQHVKDVVALEEKIKWANTPNMTIPQMKYPVSRKWKQTPLKAFINQMLA